MIEHPGRKTPDLTPKNGLTVHKVSTFQGFLELEPAWRELQDPICLSNLGSTFDILRLVLETISKRKDRIFGYDSRLCILVVRDTGKIIAIAPLVIVRRDRRIGPLAKTVTSVEFLGHPSMHVFFRFFRNIVTQQPAPALIEAIFDWLCINEKFDVLHLAFIHEDNANFHPPGPYLKSLNAVSIVEVDKFADFESYIQQIYSRHLKQNLRSSLNRAHRDGLKLELTRQFIDDAALDEIVRLTEYTPDGASYVDGHFDEFRSRLCQSQKMEVIFVRLNGHAQAYRIYLHYPGGKMELETMVHMNFRELGLGSHMIDKGIRVSFEDRLIEHCEGLFGGLHTDRFASKQKQVYKYIRAGNTLSARVAEYVINAFHLKV